MYADEFEARIARVRHRFATTLEDKIKCTMVSAEILSRSGGPLADHLTGSYQRLHTIAGVGETVGFAATGTAARTAEAALLPAYHQNRGLTEDEALCLKKALAQLKTAAASELRIMYQRGG